MAERDGRVEALAYMSAARALIDAAAETLEQHGVMFVPSRAEQITGRLDAAREELEAVAHDVLEAADIDAGNVLMRAEEDLDWSHDRVRTLIASGALVGERERVIDALLYPEPTDDELYNRPGMEGGIAYPLEHDAAGRPREEPPGYDPREHADRLRDDA